MMHTALLITLCLLFVAFLGNCWELRWFCHGYECPEHFVIDSDEDYGFEERLYNTSRWITTEVASTSQSDITDGFWKIYNYLQGQNDQGKVLPTTRPGLVSVTEVNETGERQVSVSFYIHPDTDLPTTDDVTIREEIRPSCTIYTIEFPGFATERAANKYKGMLGDYLNSKGKDFNGSRYEGAGYDSPLNLVKRHNEIWLYAI